MRSAEQRARRAEKDRERRAAESPASKRRNSVKKRERRAAESPASKRRNSEKKRERRAAESPAARLARLASDKAATRIHRQALESSIAENQHMRAEHRRQAAVVAEARCARRDATHNDAFEHLLWLHSCSGSLGVMNARRLSHLKHAGAWAALEIARQDVLADTDQHISLSTLDMAGCVSDFSDVNNVDMKVCGACGARDPDDPYSRQVRLRDLPKSHWLHVPRAAYERLTSAESFKLVVPCEHGGYSDVECCRADLHNLYRDASSGDVFHCIAIAVHKGCVHLCRQCAFGWDQSYSTPAVQYPRGDDTLAGDQYNDLYHSNAPTGSVASGLDFGQNK